MTGAITHPCLTPTRSMQAWIGLSTVNNHFSIHAVMKFLQDCEKGWWAAEFPKDHAYWQYRRLLLDQWRRDKSHKFVRGIFPVAAGNKNHISFAAPSAETTVGPMTMSTTWLRSRLSMTRAKIFPATESKEMPRLSPFFFGMLASFYCCSIFPVVQTRWMNWCNRWIKFSMLENLCRNSIPSDPAVLQDLTEYFSPFTATLTSCMAGGWKLRNKCTKVGSVGLTQLSSSVRCSAQRDRMPSWSLMTLVPSLD